MCYLRPCYGLQFPAFEPGDASGQEPGSHSRHAVFCELLDTPGLHFAGCIHLRVEKHPVSIAERAVLCASGAIGLGSAMLRIVIHGHTTALAESTSLHGHASLPCTCLATVGPPGSPPTAAHGISQRISLHRLSFPQKSACTQMLQLSEGGFHQPVPVSSHVQLLRHGRPRMR